MGLWIFLIILGVIILGLILAYNSLVRLKTQTQEGWSDIDVQLKRRYNLIPNLIESVKGYAKHEKELFIQITQARTMAMGANSITDHAQAENMLTGALKSLFAVAESYPDLKASNNFLKLQEELADTENKIQAARRFYNGIVRDYNIKLAVFPINLIAGMFGFLKADFFELEDKQERENVEVKF